MKEEFLMRTVSDSCKVGEVAVIKVSRTRTNERHSSIEVILAGRQGITEQRITFTTDQFDDAYELVAMKFAEKLEEICEDKCLLSNENKAGIISAKM